MKKKNTNINESARHGLGITRDEYALCSYVQYRQADRRGKAGWCVDPKQEIADFIGITRPGLYKMIDRLSGENLLFVDPANGAIQVTEKWLDAETERKQSLQPGVNKVYSECKQSLQPGVNKVTPNIEVQYEYKVKESVSEVNQSSPAPAQNSPTLETKPALEGEFPAGPAAPMLLPPRWSEIPNVNTSSQLRAYLSRFYKAYPEEWRNTKDGTPAMAWNDEKTKEVVSRFCDWAITEGFERRTLKQINARLKMWLKDEPHMSRKEPQQDTRPLRAMKVYGQ